MAGHNNTRALRAVERALAVGQGRVRIAARTASTQAPLLRVSYGRLHTDLLPVWAGEGFPKDVQRAVRDSGGHPVESGVHPVVTARRMSRGARAWLADHGLSWADEEGNAVISAEPALLVVRDAGRRSVPTAADDEMRWSEGSAAVAEHLLDLASTAASGGEQGTAVVVPPVAAIAATVDISPPFVSRTLQGFDGQGWTTKAGAERGPQARRDLTDVTGLLSAWAAWRSRHRGVVVRAHRVIRDPNSFVDEEVRSAWAGCHWALTGWLALDRRAPFATSSATIDLYVDRETMRDDRRVDDLLDRVGLRRVDTGARVRLLEADPYTVSLFRQSPREHEVSDVRLYADLLRSGVRGEESAEFLRAERIGF